MRRDPTDTAFHGVMLSVLCVISYWLITHMLAHAFSLSRDDDLLGDSWAVAATVFVYHYGQGKMLPLPCRAWRQPF
jgi:hypothetical protein